MDGITTTPAGQAAGFKDSEETSLAWPNRMSNGDHLMINSEVSASATEVKKERR
jgi:hypothetical protein